MSVENNLDSYVVYRSIGEDSAERYGFGVIDRPGTGKLSGKGRPSYSLVLVLSGEGLYHDSDHGDCPLRSGVMLQCIPEVPHSVVIDSTHPWKECFIEVTGAMTELLRHSGCFNHRSPVLKNPPSSLFLEKFCQLRKIFRSGSDGEVIDHLPELLSLIVHCTADSGPSSRISQWRSIIEQACIHLGQNFEQPENLTEFCRNFGVGYENFRKIFKQETGMSPHRYRVRRRLDAACAMLIKRQLSVSEIAGKLGYSSPYEFSSQFRRQIGVSPSNYRAR